jgi:non-specific serine/threonine protein kinase
MAERNWQQIKEIFYEALRHPTEERDAFLDKACGGDVGFRIEVESLLISLTEAKGFLEEPILGKAPKPRSDWLLAKDQEISHYKIIEPIGIGGMGEVYLAEDTSLRRRVALKILPEHLLASKERLRRFQREAEVVSTLNHPNILTVFEFGAAGDIHLLACEFVKGKTVRERLANDGPFGVDETLDVSAQVASALQAAHDAGIIHRDIKPENVMIRDDGYVKVLDFGLAKLTEKVAADGKAETRMQVYSSPGLIMGTVAYMSPEQTRALPTDARSDLFSFGVLIYEMLTGTSPFKGETTTDVLAAIIQLDPPPLSQTVREIPPELDRIVAKSLEKERPDRYQTATEMLADIRELQKRLAIQKEIGSIRHTSSAAETEILPDTLTADSGDGESLIGGRPGEASFIGRAKEIGELTALFRRDDVRLVTLTGIGGVGKTRLSREAARRLRPRFSDGIHFVELAAVKDPALFIPTLAHALALSESGPKKMEDALTEHLRDRTTLLVLDNFEQLIAAGPEIVRLLAVASGLKMLVTSREPLKLSAETEYPVSPLSMPPPGVNVSAKEIGEFEAVKLFVQSARKATPGFQLSDDDAASVAEICSRLDGLPLAIELAAARTKILSPSEILAKLENRLAILTGGSRDLPARQRTMRAAIEWSYELLNQDEKRVFAGLSVFACGFTFETAEMVIQRGSAIPPETDFLDVITSLTEKGLIVSLGRAGKEPRLRLLDVVREYASEELEAGSGAELMHLAHAEYYLRLAEQAEPHLKSADAVAWLTRLEQDHGNIRAALGWSLENRPAIAAQLGAAVRNLWTIHNHLNEGSNWLSRILERNEAIADGPRWKILTAYGAISQFQGAVGKARELYDEGLAIARRLNEPSQIAQSLRGLAALAYIQSDFASTRKHIDEALAICRAANDEFGIAASLARLGDVSFAEGDFKASSAFCEESLRILRRIGYKEGISAKLTTSALAAIALGEHRKARSYLVEAVAISLELDERINTGHIFDGFAALATELKDHCKAARLAGVAERTGASIGYALEPAERRFRDTYLSTLRKAMPAPEFEKEFSEGGSMSLREAQKLAVEESGPAPRDDYSVADPEANSTAESPGTGPRLRFENQKLLALLLVLALLATLGYLMHFWLMS